MVIFFDTNVLVYQAINQDEQKQTSATKIIESCIKSRDFFISPLVLTEFIYVLNRLKILDEHQDKIEIYKHFSCKEIELDVVLQAYNLCFENQICKNINDVIHLKTAEKYCSKIVTFDKDFKKLLAFAKIPIDVPG